MVVSTESKSRSETIVVTGAAGGMGRATCQYLSSLGWSILALDHNVERLAVLENESIHTLVCEIEEKSLGKRVVEKLQKMPTVWGLVNLVGVSKGSDLENLSEDDWQYSFDVNVTPAFRLAQALLPLMKERGGSIVNVGSPVGVIGARKPSYAASKAALQGLTASLARNLGKHDIRVNLLLPGPTITEMTKDWNEEKRQQIAQGTFLKRLCTVQEIAEGISFLLNEHSRYMSGSVLDMTCGGMWGH